MNQRYVLIIFVLIILVSLGGMGVNFLKEKIGQEFISDNLSSAPTPTPLPEEIIFGSGQSTLKQNSAEKNSVSQPKTIKQYRQFPGILSPDELRGKKAVIETAKGNIELEIYPEASKAASNFIFLARDGFYDSLSFHRVEPGFVIQGGDPLGNGSGGPGYTFEDERVSRSYDRGIVAMANSGPNTNGSQFFIMLADKPDLPPKYTIFGKVIGGMDVVDRIEVGDIMKKVSILELEGARKE